MNYLVLVGAALLSSCGPKKNSIESIIQKPEIQDQAELEETQLQAPIETISQTKEDEEVICEINPKNKSLLEEHLSRWPSHITDDIEIINFSTNVPNYFVAQYIFNNQLMFNNNVPEKLFGNIKSTNHEMGHHIYHSLYFEFEAKEVELQKQIEGLTHLHPNKDELNSIQEYKIWQKELNNPIIFDTYSKEEFTALEKTLLEHSEAECAKNFVTTTYLIYPKFNNKFLQAANLFGISVTLTEAYSDQFTEEEIIVLLTYQNNFLATLGSLADLKSNIVMTYYESGSVCNTENFEKIQELSQYAFNELDYLIEQENTLSPIFEKGYSKTDIKEKNIKINFPMNYLFNASTGYYQEVITDELFARATDSLLNVYLGEADTGTFELNENILSQFEKIRLKDGYAYTPAVARYREALKLKESGMPIEQIREQILSEVETYEIPGKIICE